MATVTAAPAFAASCSPRFEFRGGFGYDWGVVNAATTTQRATVGGQTDVLGLPPTVTVTGITYAFWIENRIGQSSPGPGAFWMGNPSSDQQGYCTSNGCTAPFQPPSGSGWAAQVTNTANLFGITHPSGDSLRSWDINMSWRPTGSEEYNTDASGCRSFSTGPSGRFAVTYSDVTALGSATPEQKRIRTFVRVIVKLSNDQTLSRDIASS